MARGHKGALRSYPSGSMRSGRQSSVVSFGGSGRASAGPIAEGRQFDGQRSKWDADLDSAVGGLSQYNVDARGVGRAIRVGNVFRRPGSQMHQLLDVSHAREICDASRDSSLTSG